MAGSKKKAAKKGGKEPPAIEPDPPPKRRGRKPGQVDRTPRKARTDAPARKKFEADAPAADAASGTKKKGEQLELKNYASSRSRLARAEADLKETKAKLEQIKLEQQSGLLISREQRDREDLAKVIAVRTGLLSLPDRCAADCAAEDDPRRCRAILLEAVTDLLHAFAGDAKKAAAKASK
ncbi:MAG TPA: hypothetical protein VEL28_13100 [Candidatus Binatia bacterium]|nr:hypothetical protein [Candidatus Binatia bacterium]